MLSAYNDQVVVRLAFEKLVGCDEGVLVRLHSDRGCGWEGPYKVSQQLSETILAALEVYLGGRMDGKLKCSSHAMGWRARYSSGVLVARLRWSKP